MNTDDCDDLDTMHGEWLKDPAYRKAYALAERDYEVRKESRWYPTRGRLRHLMCWLAWCGRGYVEVEPNVFECCWCHERSAGG